MTLAGLSPLNPSDYSAAYVPGLDADGQPVAPTLSWENAVHLYGISGFLGMEQNDWYRRPGGPGLAMGGDKAFPGGPWQRLHRPQAQGPSNGLGQPLMPGGGPGGHRPGGHETSFGVGAEADFWVQEPDPVALPPVPQDCFTAAK